MPRNTRDTLILVKIETTVGTDALPTGAANAVLVTDFDINPLDANNVDRNLIRGYFGASEQLVVTASKKCSFTVELAGSGTAGIAPALGALLQGCGMAESILASPARVEYTPVSTGLKTLTIYYYDSGVLHKLLSSMGNVTLSAKVGDRPTLKFEFTGLDGGDTVASTTGSFSAWKTPVTMTKANVTDVTLGATYAAGAITGGQVYSSTGLEINLNNSVQYTPLLSAERIDIVDRAVSGSVELDLTAAQEVSFMSAVRANTTQSMALTIGTVVGNKLIIYGSAAQLANPKKVDLNRTRLIGYELRLVPTPGGSGNDELRLAFI